MADMKVLVFNCRKVLEINCRKLLDFTCFLQEIENAFFAEYEDALEDTKNIKSSQVNTLEILFEAEELEKVIQEKEEKNIWDVAPAIEKYNGEVIPADLVKNDPEAIIRLLKAKKGII